MKNDLTRRRRRDKIIWSHVVVRLPGDEPVYTLNEGASTMAKRQPTHTEFTLREARHFAARGPQAALTAIEKAIKDGLTVLHEVWVWVVNFADNPRALSLLKANAPALVPAKHK